MCFEATGLSENVVSIGPVQPTNNQKLPNIGDPFNPFGMFNGIWVPESLVRCPEIPASAKLLYARLARYAGRDGRCFPSVEKLAVELGMSARHIQRLLFLLCSANFLRKDAQYRPNGSQTVNAYVFLYHAALVPAKVMTTELASSAEPLGPSAKVPGDKNVTGGVTSSPPLEDRPLNRSGDSSRSSRSPNQTVHSAADDDAERYPLSTARFREFFPRTVTSVIARILEAILQVCPDGTDEDIAAAVGVEPDQKSPGLWVCTMPDRVRNEILRRMAATPPAINCQRCRDAGVLWDEESRACWCPVDCDASAVERRARPHFVDEWNSQLSRPEETLVTSLLGPAEAASQRSRSLQPRQETVERFVTTQR
jgi:GntR family transcriptional regulator